MARRSILVALRGGQEEELLRQLSASGEFEAARRCADIAEVLAAALAGVGAIAVIDHLLGVDRSLIARLQQVGVVTVVIAPEANRGAYEEMGARVLDPRSPDLVAGLAAVVADPEPVRLPAEEVAATGAQEATIIAVTSAWGGPGRTTVAVNLAAEIAARGTNPLLVDADIWGASVKQYLGLDPDGAGIAAAIRAVERGTFTLEGLRRLTEDVAGIAVLGGLNKSERWREVSGGAVTTFWQTLRTWPGHIIVDAPVRIPTDGHEGPSLYGPAPNAMWEEISGAATQVCVVGGADTVGIHRFINFLLDHPRPGAHAVINRLRPSAAGPRAKESIEELLQRYARMTDPLLIPHDDAVDRAILNGQPLRVAAPKSPARVGIRALAERLLPGRPRTKGPRFGRSRPSGGD